MIDTSDWAALQREFDRLADAPLTTDNVDSWLREWSDLEAHLIEDTGAAASRSHENTADEEAEALYLHYVKEILPRSRVEHERLKARLLRLEGYEPPEGLEQLMRDFRTEQRLFREENLPLKSELDVLVNRFRKITGQMTVEHEGKSLTLNQAELLLMEQDRALRERIWRRIMAEWQASRGTIDDLYLEMLALRRRMAANADLPNFRAYAWLERGRHDYTPDDAQTFLDAIEHEVVPVARRVYARRREALDVETLRPWDLDVDPSGLPPLRPFESVEELEAGCSRIFHAIDPVLGEQFDLLRDGYLELESRPNKAPGGYCRSLPVSRKSYIFMNAVGTHRNVQTLLHEGGHAFHNQHAVHLPLIWTRHAGLEMAEVASMGMEMLAQPYLAREAGGFYSAADARRAQLQHLEKVVTFLPYMAVVDGFQHWVYTEAPETVTADDLDAIWAALWDRFMDGIEYAGLEEEKESGWHRKRHIFIHPFYYIEYGLAEVGALQLWRNAREDQAEALRRYREALSYGGTLSTSALFERAGVRFAFDRETLAELMTLAEREMDALRDGG